MVARPRLASRRARSIGRGGERGAALVEFALLLPVLVVLVLGTIDFGFLINRSTVLNSAAREGAREAIFEPDVVAVEARVRAATKSLDQSLLTVTVSCRDAGGADCAGVSFVDEWQPGGTVIVDVDYEYFYLSPATPILGLGTSRNLSSVVEMRIEG